MRHNVSFKYYLGFIFLSAAVFFGVHTAQAQTGDVCVFACWGGIDPGVMTLTVTPSPSTITLGESSTVSWSSSWSSYANCTSYGFPNSPAVVATVGSEVVTPTTAGSYTYSISCWGIFGFGSGSGTLTVNPAVPPPATASLSANPTSVTSGGSSLLTWGSTNATSCTGTNFSTGGATSGSVSTGALSSTRNYSVSCTGAGGSGSANATVTVSGHPNLRISAGPTPTSAVPGTAQTYSATVQNNGTASAVASATRFQRATSSGGAGATTISDVSTSALNANATQVRSVSYTHPSAGTFYIRACADIGSVVSESNESDNCSSWVAVTSASTLSGSCSASPTSVTIGGSTTWTANPTGGNGTYTYSWSGTNSLTGTTRTISKVYTTPGTKTASVTITSAGISRTIACSNSVSVTTTQCSDGIDNNGNGLIDTADTVVCPTASDPFEEAIPEAVLLLTPNASIIRTGSTVVLSWSATNASSCSLTGTNGDSWTLTGSSGTRTSSALTSETTFTLRCTDLNNSPVSTSTTVRITPSFEEVLRQVPQLLASVISGWF